MHSTHHRCKNQQIPRDLVQMPRSLFNPGLGPPPRPGVVPTADKRSDRPGPPDIHPAGIPQDSALPPKISPKIRKDLKAHLHRFARRLIVVEHLLELNQERKLRCPIQRHLLKNQHQLNEERR